MLGGIEIDLDVWVFKVDGMLLVGLYVVGEVVGFGGGGVYGYWVLEGIFLGGCIFFGCVVGCGVVEDICQLWLFDIGVIVCVRR